MMTRRSDLPKLTLSSRSSTGQLCPGSARTRARLYGRNRRPACAHGRELKEAPKIEINPLCVSCTHTPRFIFVPTAQLYTKKSISTKWMGILQLPRLPSATGDPTTRSLSRRLVSQLTPLVVPPQVSVASALNTPCATTSECGFLADGKPACAHGL